MSKTISIPWNTSNQSCQKQFQFHGTLTRKIHDTQYKEKTLYQRFLRMPLLKYPKNLFIADDTGGGEWSEVLTDVFTLVLLEVHNTPVCF
jgi:hypothetical protein